MRVKMNQMEKSHKDAMELQQVGNYICTSGMSQSACRIFGEKCRAVGKKNVFAICFYFNQDSLTLETPHIN